MRSFLLLSYYSFCSTSSTKSLQLSVLICTVSMMVVTSLYSSIAWNNTFMFRKLSLHHLWMLVLSCIAVSKASYTFSNEMKSPALSEKSLNLILFSCSCYSSLLYLQLKMLWPLTIITRVFSSDGRIFLFGLYLSIMMASASARDMKG